MCLRMDFFVAGLCLSAASLATAEVVLFDESDSLVSWHAEGLWDLEGLGTFNGQPVSPTNMPSEFHRRLAANVSIYGIQGVANQAYLRISDVVSTQGLSFFGVDAWLGDHALTSVHLSLRSAGGASYVPVRVSSEYAQEGQVLLYGTGGSDTHADPLLSTPGWIASMDNGGFQVSCAGFPANAMVNYSSYWGPTSRIRGGGVFLLDFGATSLVDVDWGLSTATVGFGNQSQFFNGVLVPVPGAMMPLAGLLGVLRRRRRD